MYGGFEKTSPSFSIMKNFHSHRMWTVFLKLGVPPNSAREWLGRTEEDRSLKMTRSMYVQFGGVCIENNRVSAPANLMQH